MQGEPPRSVTVVLLCLAVMLLVMGIVSGEAAIVWQKASFICLECLGLG